MRPQPDSDQATAADEFVVQLVQHRQRLFGYILALVPNLADAEDLFQRTSLILWRKFGEFDSQRDFSAWACGIAFLEVQNFRRTRGRDRLQFDDLLLQQLAAEHAVNDEAGALRQRLLYGCIDALPSADRGLVRECYQGDDTIQSVAFRLGQSTNALYKRLQRIRHKLHDCVRRKFDLGARPA